MFGKYLKRRHTYYICSRQVLEGKTTMLDGRERESLKRWVEANKVKFKEDDNEVLHFKSQRNGNIWAG